MKSSLLHLGLCATLSSANIIFNWVQPSCDHTALDYTGCLRGQDCSVNDTCLTHGQPTTERVSERYIGITRLPRDTPAYSQDGTCGPNNGNTICDPNSTVYTGSCCSQYGWCGNTDAHCGTGCISGCTSAAPTSVAAAGGATPSATTTYRDDGHCGKDYGNAGCDPNGPFGGCCSEYGWCGKTDGHCLVANGCQSGCTDAAPTSAASGASSATSVNAAATSSGEPVLGKPTTTAAGTAATGAVTTDGTCGAANKGTVCGNWPQGNCCSMYGFCGQTTAHCGDGCQSGNCTGAPVVAAPGPAAAPANANPGNFRTLDQQSGAPAMHAGLLPNGQVVFLDKVENYTQLKFPSTDAKHPNQYAYSSEYDPSGSKQAVPLAYDTNAFCAGGTFLADGTFISVGGNAPLDFIDPTVGDGFKGLRYLKRTVGGNEIGQAWVENGNKLSTARWYASVQTMPNGEIFVASGSLNGLDPTVKANNNPTYEVLNADGSPQGTSIPMDLLVKTQPYYMYPFIHLLRDGTMFIFVSKTGEIFDLATNTTKKTFTDLPGDYRTYPNTGGSVLLPLSSASNWDPDVIICGGGAYQDITSPTDPSCGRIQPLAANPSWEMDAMPEGRGMVEGTLLPDGTVVFLNGGNSGAQGFGLAKNPTFEALIYDPTQALGKRWTTGASTTIARLYHSVALLLLDGTMMIAGSNPVEQPILTPSAQNPFVTEFRVEIYTPPYLTGDKPSYRPTNVNIPVTALKTGTGSTFKISFDLPKGGQAVKVALYHGGFVTHSVHMGHRMAFLDTQGWQAGANHQDLTVTMTPSTSVTPPGPYVVYVVVDGIPSVGQFVMVS